MKAIYLKSLLFGLVTFFISYSNAQCYSVSGAELSAYDGQYTPTGNINEYGYGILSNGLYYMHFNGNFWIIYDDPSSYDNIAFATNYFYVPSASYTPPNSGWYFSDGAFSTLSITNCALNDNAILSSSSIQICGGDDVTLYADGTLLNGDNWYWYEQGCGNNYVGQGNSITVYPNATTTYYCRSEGFGFQGTCSEITVVVSPSIWVNPIITPASCNGGSIEANVQYGSGNYAYIWRDATYNFISDSYAIYDVPTGSYYLEVFDLVFGCSFFGQYYIDQISCPQNDFPNLSSSSNQTCPGNGVNLYADGTLLNGDNWYWYEQGCGNNYIGQGNSITVYPNASTTYYCRSEGFGFQGTCSQISIDVSALSVDPYITPASCFSGGSIETYVQGGSGYYNYTWYDENFNYISSDFAIYNVPSGVYSLEVYDYYYNCLFNGQYTIQTVNCDDIASLTSSSNQTCPSNGVTLYANGSLVNGNDWYWYEQGCGNIYVGQGNSISVNPNTSTTYYCRSEGFGFEGTCSQITIDVSALSVNPYINPAACSQPKTVTSATFKFLAYNDQSCGNGEYTLSVNGTTVINDAIPNTFNTCGDLYSIPLNSSDLSLFSDGYNAVNFNITPLGAYTSGISNLIWAYMDVTLNDGSTVQMDVYNSYLSNYYDLCNYGPTASSCWGYSDLQGGGNLNLLNGGSIEAYVQGGTGYYSYTWRDLNNNFISDYYAIYDVPVGIYSLEVYDINGCSFFGQFTVDAVSSFDTYISGSNNPTCPGSDDGSINVEIQNACGNVFYSWTGPNGFSANSQDINNLTAGVYTLYATDNNQTDTLTIELNNPNTTPLIINENILPVSCDRTVTSATLKFLAYNDQSCGNGEYTLSVNGTQVISDAIPNTTNSCGDLYSIPLNSSDLSLFSDGYNAVNFNIAPFGQFTSGISNLIWAYIDVTLNDGSNVQMDVYYSYLANFYDLCNYGTTASTCWGDSDLQGGGNLNLLNGGSIEAYNVQGGFGNYNYSWYDANNNLISSDYGIYDLPVGNYSLTVTDFCGSSISESYTVTGANGVVVDTANSYIFSPTCQANGFIDILVVGDCGVNTFSWENAANPGIEISSNEDLYNVGEGSYVLYASNSNGTSVYNFVLDAPQITIQDQVMNYSCNSSIYVYNIQGGSGNYFLSWTDENGTLISNDYSIYNLQQGNYTLSIYDDCGNTFTKNYSIQSTGGPSSSFETYSSCDSYFWNGQFYTQSGTYTYVTTNSSGCDSVATLYLTINNSNTTFVTEIACDVFVWNNVSYSNSGVYTKVFTNAAGCDSVVTLNLTINNSETTSVTETACEVFVWNNVSYSNSGVYTAVFTNAAGCDSTVSLNLTIHNPTITNIDTTVCNLYLWNGNNLTSSGIYYDTLVSTNGCDSIIKLFLTVNDGIANSLTTSACDFYIWNGITYNQSATYTASDACGVGVVDTLILTINNSVINTIDVAACSSYTWNGTPYTSSGSYTYTGQTIAGCDSTVVLNLTINQPSASSTTQAACGSYQWNGNTYTQSGTYTFAATNVAGCDSTATLVLTITPITGSSATQIACGSYTWNGNNYTQSGTYTFNTSGCIFDTLYLTIKQPSYSTTTHAICGGSYTWNNSTYTQSGIHTYTTLNAVGCDSIATLILTIDNALQTPVIAVTSDSILTVPQQSGVIYQWIDCATNTLIPNENTNTYIASSSGSYAVIALNQCGVDTSDCQIVTISDLDELTSESILVYPNPTLDKLTIEVDENLVNETYYLFDHSGRIVLTGKFDSVKQTVSIEQLSSGTYILQLSNEQFRSKIIKQ